MHVLFHHMCQQLNEETVICGLPHQSLSTTIVLNYPNCKFMFSNLVAVGETGVIWTGFCFYRVGRFLIIRFVK